MSDPTPDNIPLADPAKNALAQLAGDPKALALVCQAALDIAQAQKEAAQAHLRGAQLLEASHKALSAQIEQAKGIAEALQKAQTEAARASHELREQAGELSRSAIIEAAAALSGAHPDFQNAIQFFQLDLAVTKRLASSVRGAWKMGEAFSLEAEPSNAHDPNAIKVLQNGSHVGYISAEHAKRIKKLTGLEGWTLSGEAYLSSAKGGQWDEGKLQARMANPVAGWRGYNPVLPFEKNLAAMESAVLLAATAPTQPGAGPSARARSASL